MIKVPCAAVVAFLLFLVSCAGKEGAPEEQIVAKEITGGDSTSRTVELEYIDLDLPERHYVVFRQELSLLDMNGFLGMESEALNLAAREAGLETTGPPASLFYAWDTQAGQGDAAVALPVAEGTSLPPYVTITLPARKALALELKGAYDGLTLMHLALDEELKRRGLKAEKPSIEEYIVGPLDTKDPTKFHTRIVYTFASPAE